MTASVPIDDRSTSAVPVHAPVGPLLRAEFVDELRAIVREPAALLFSVAMPVGFFTLFVTIWGGEATGGTTVGTSMLATFGTFGVIGVTLLNPGIGIADDRERGWLRAKRVSGTPVGITLLAKVLATLPYAVAVLGAMTAVSALSGTLEADLATWLRLAAVLVLGALPFALLGLGVGLLATPNATTAILNAVFIPSAVVSGLWMPLETLPDVLGSVAPWLPTYHLAQLGLAQLDGSGSLPHLAALALFALLAALGAGFAYRRARP